VLIAAQ